MDKAQMAQKVQDTRTALEALPYIVTSLIHTSVSTPGPIDFDESQAALPWLNAF